MNISEITKILSVNLKNKTKLNKILFLLFADKRKSSKITESHHSSRRRKHLSCLWKTSQTISSCLSSCIFSPTIFFQKNLFFYFPSSFLSFVTSSTPYDREMTTGLLSKSCIICVFRDFSNRTPNNDTQRERQKFTICCPQHLQFFNIIFF